ncbi:MAG: glucose-1-phosphate cytidylyltransferase [Thermoanaerobaculia bacterium]
MKAVILCGGQGTRIRDASEILPKPMLPIGNRPIVWHIMKIYSAFGINDFVLCLGYKGWLIKEFFLNYRAATADVTVHLGQDRPHDFRERQNEEKWNVTLVDTGDQTQTGGRLAAVREYVEGDEPFCLTYGDGVADLDIGKLIEFHRRHGKIATVTAVRPTSRFGEIRMEDSVVREFNEKPQAVNGSINGGFFVLDGHRTWKYLGDDPNVLLEKEPMQNLADDGELIGFPHTGFWQPMDTLREYNLLNELWAGGDAPWKLW